MRRITLFAVVLALAGCGRVEEKPSMSNHGHHTDGGHEHHAPTAGAEIIVRTEPKSPAANEPVTLHLMIHRRDGSMVRDFEIVHEERVHLAVISEDLRHFAHLHPAVDTSGSLTVTHEFPAGGRYRLFADYATGRDGPGMAEGALEVGGEAAAAGELVADAPGTITADGVVADVTAERLEAGRHARVRLRIRSADGGAVTLERFMGEFGHLMAVGAGTWRYVHAHPADADAANGWVEFESVFEEPGLYKAWGQIKHEGRVRVIPFVVRVKSVP